MNAHPGLCVRGLRKTFFGGTVQEKTVLNGVSFSLQSGEFAVLVGSNGAGKSTTINAVAGDLLVDEGQIFISELNVTSLPAYKRAHAIARVFQDPMKGTAAALSIYENLALADQRGRRRGLRLGLSKAKVDRFRASLSVLGLGLENRLKDHVSQLSGGQRQSLTLIMATLNEPQILLLDEHTAALDPRAAELVMKASLEAIRRSGAATLMVTHNMEHAVNYGDRLLMMHDGKIIFDLNSVAKAKTTAAELVERFHHVISDRMMFA